MRITKVGSILIATFCVFWCISTLPITQQPKPYLWVYWENTHQRTTPAHISLCRKTLLKQCRDSFNVIELNEKNIYQYLPELKTLEPELLLHELKIAQKVDYYRILLLYKYGGLYLDADMIVMNDLISIIEKLRTYDYVGFGDYEYIRDKAKASSHSYGAPQNWAMASRKNGILVGHLVSRATEILTSRKDRTRAQRDYMIERAYAESLRSELAWHTLGKYLLHSTLKTLISKKYSYFHFPTDVDGTRDVKGHYINTQRIFSDEKITFKNEKKLLFICLSNAVITSERTQLDNILQMSEAELLAQKTNFAFFIKKSLELQP